jgi:hypothetical protein
MENERNNKINYLDITITRGESNTASNVFRKPTVTSTTIHNTSCRQQEHKRPAFRYLQNRLNT